MGFGVKVMPTGRVSFIVEARIRGGSTKRITLGQSPAMSAIAARARAAECLQKMQLGIDPIKEKKVEAARKDALSKSLDEVFNAYVSNRGLKANTQSDYRTTFRLVFSSWANRPMREITRQDAEEVFADTRDNRGHATAT